MSKENRTLVLPLLPLRDIVAFPYMVMPLYVGRSKSIHAIEDALAHSDGHVLLTSQKKSKVNEPTFEDLNDVGCLAQVVQHLVRPDGTFKVLIEGKNRAKITRFVPNDGFMLAECHVLEEIPVEGAEVEGLIRTVRESLDTYARLSQRLPADLLTSMHAIEEVGQLCDTLAVHLGFKHPDKQLLLEMVQRRDRLEKLYELLQAEIEILQVERKIRTRVKRQMAKSEKEYYLNEQMRAIQKELGARDEFKNEWNELSERLKTVKMPEDSRGKIDKELKKLKMMSPTGAEATVIRTYVDWCLSLPWQTYTQTQLDMDAANKILDEDHFGLEKPKERILEYLAVHKLLEKVRGPILCFVGPPGVGKTSLARSIARAIGRPFARVALGGVRDEAEIRGHRRTYIGAMPGKIIQAMKRAGSANPVILLDEIDKMATDFRGDPSSALLEVLDPEQNAAFNDHYLDLDYDLSNVMFICTANSAQDIPMPLEDRLEQIRIAGYTEQEKLAIAEKYLIPKQRKENGVENIAFAWPDTSTKIIIEQYTREAGVRTLEREIASICRKVAREVVTQKTPPKRVVLTPQKIKTYLGVPKYRHNKREEQAHVGLCTGLAWTQMGGEILHIEVTTMPGKGKLLITGKLGDVMQESAQAAMSYVRSRATAWGLLPDFYANIDIHIHVPEGAIPKDGPSAGITIATALVSALTKIPVRRDIAMTGEITLRGNVLPIGGLKEKALAAHREGLLTILIPYDNEKDIEEIPPSIAKTMCVKVVQHMDEVLKEALLFDDTHSFLPKASVLVGEEATLTADGDGDVGLLQ